jgi:AAA15 family ATPase/GTPase
LITGKNNVGKSSLLEAIVTYICKADLRTIYQLLDDRGENFIKNSNKENILENGLKAFSSIFTNREVSFKKSDLVSISTNENQPLSIGFVKYIEIEDVDEDDREPILKRIAVNEESNSNESYYGLEIKIGDNSRIRPLDRTYPILNSKGNHNFQYLRARNIDNETNGSLWDNITLTEKESFVIGALQIIDPSIDRIAFIQDSPKLRSTVLKSRNNDVVVPMKSMGDGINRIFSIILAMVNAENGYLLIDEFENGLHHTVQKKLWEIIFKLSEKLNVQVFATTHSEDSINSFQFVLNDLQNISVGKLIRLDNKKGQIKEVEFNAKELEIATSQNIEIR